MESYDSLVKALRHCVTRSNGCVTCTGCPMSSENGDVIECINALHQDAADALEATEQRITELERELEIWTARSFEGKIGSMALINLDLRMEISKLKAQVPKRGKWIITAETSDDGVVSHHINCSVCGFYWREPKHRKIFKRCPNCGANMNDSNALNALNAQDGPMEVQDGQK